MRMVSLFECENCGKSFRTVSDCKEHEENCKNCEFPIKLFTIKLNDNGSMFMNVMSFPKARIVGELLHLNSPESHDWDPCYISDIKFDKPMIGIGGYYMFTSIGMSDCSSIVKIQNEIVSDLQKQMEGHQKMIDKIKKFEFNIHNDPYDTVFCRDVL